MMQKNHAYTAFLLILIIFGSANAQLIRNEKPAYPEGLNVLNADNKNVSLTFSLHEFEMKEIEVNGSLMKTIHMPGVFLPSQAGMPGLPTLSRMIAIPKGSKASYKINVKQTFSTNNVTVAPAPAIPKDTDKGPLAYNANALIYNTDSFYPASPVMLSEPDDIRGMDVVMVAITPFQYNPVTKELITYVDLSVDITITGGSGAYGDDRLRSIWWEPVYSEMLLNYASLPKAHFPRYDPKSKTPDYEYLIITPNNPDFIHWADTIKNWRNRQGIRTGVVTLSEIGGNDSALIRNYIKNAYYSWAVPPVAVLFLGDYGTGGAAGTGIISPVYNSYCVSDNIYVDVNQNHLPEISSSRIAAQNAQQLQTIIGKMLSYERNPPMSDAYYKKPLIAGGWQTERWFILCTEVIYGYLANKQSKTPVREYAIYTGTPGASWSSNQNTSTVVNYFGPNGLNYIPSTPQHLTDWGGNASRISADINAGTFLVQHRDHGDVTGWGEPSFLNSNVSALNNSFTTYVFSMNCLTGKFNNSSDCFAEIFMRHPKGAYGMIAATEVSYSFVNDAYTWGVFDYMFPDFDPNYGQTTAINMLPCFANSAGKIYLKASSWPYNTQNKEVTYHLFHHHGDAFTRINTEVPQPMAVQHDTLIIPAKQSLCIKAPAGAMICISKNNQIVETAVSGGEQMCFFIGTPMPREIYTVTVTRQNSLRYTRDVPVVDGYIAMHVNFPNGGETLRAGLVRNITWTSSTARKVKIEYTTNSGASWVTAADSVNAAPSSYAWTVPNELSNQCKVRLTNVDSTSISDVSDNVFTITSQYCQDVSVNSYWNLLSVPVASSIRAAASLFPTANSAVFEFNGGYSQVTELGNGKGYWVRFPAAQTIPVCGEQVSGNTISLAAGWNIIGPFHNQVSTASCATAPANIINSGYFGYNDGYIPVTTLLPGKGYWIRTTQAGTLLLGSAAAKADKQSPACDDANWINITVTDAAGRTKTLYVISNSALYTSAGAVNKFALPPMPPDGAFDVRFADDCFAGTLEGRLQFNISGAVFPITIHVSGADLMLNDVVSAGRMLNVKMNDGGQIQIVNPAVNEIEILNVKPLENFALEQNYPNPFNPATTIVYRLAAAGETTVKVYDMLGNEAAVLVNERQDKGRHSLTWNAGSLASGVYFYELVSGGYRQVKKLTLLK